MEEREEKEKRRERVRRGGGREGGKREGRKEGIEWDRKGGEKDIGLHRDGYIHNIRKRSVTQNCLFAQYANRSQFLRRDSLNIN